MEKFSLSIIAGGFVMILLGIIIFPVSHMPQIKQDTQLSMEKLSIAPKPWSVDKIGWRDIIRDANRVPVVQVLFDKGTQPKDVWALSEHIVNAANTYGTKQP